LDLILEYSRSTQTRTSRTYQTFIFIFQFITHGAARIAFALLPRRRHRLFDNKYTHRPEPKWEGRWDNSPPQPITMVCYSKYMVIGQVDGTFADLPPYNIIWSGALFRYFSEPTVVRRSGCLVPEYPRCRDRLSSRGVTVGRWRKWLVTPPTCRCCDFGVSADRCTYHTI